MSEYADFEGFKSGFSLARRTTYKGLRIKAGYYSRRTLPIRVDEKFLTYNTLNGLYEKEKA